MKELRGITPQLHIFICVNDRSERPANTMPSCAPHISANEFLKVKQWLGMNGLLGRVFCTQTKCLGFCNPEGGVIALYPQGTFYAGITSAAEIIDLVKEQL